jgi:hypothetical protein
MYARYLNAPLLLFLWQVAPVDVGRDDSGRLEVSVTGGVGAYAFEDYPASASCAGSRPAGSRAREYKSQGASVALWAKNTIRVLTAAGSIRDATRERSGAFWAAQAGIEQEVYGIGLGLASFGGSERVLKPSGSLRLGPLDGFSLRADYHRPEAGMGLIGGPRVGVGLNQGRTRKTGLFVGLAMTPIPDSARRAGGFAELVVPLGFLDRKGGVSISGFYSGVRHGNADKEIFSFGVGAWIRP